MTQGTNKELAIACVSDYLELLEWLLDCPLRKADAFLDTAQRDFDGLFETGHQALIDEGAPILAERFREIHKGEISDGTPNDTDQKHLQDLIHSIEGL